jgi:hypothetical protein
MTHLFLAILLKKGFDFTDYSIVGVPIILIVSIIIAYRVPLATPFQMVFSIALLSIIFLSLLYLEPMIAFLVLAGIFVGILGQVFFTKKKTPES